MGVCGCTGRIAGRCHGGKQPGLWLGHEFSIHGWSPESRLLLLLSHMQHTYSQKQKSPPEAISLRKLLQLATALGFQASSPSPSRRQLPGCATVPCRLRGTFLGGWPANQFVATPMSLPHRQIQSRSALALRLDSSWFYTCAFNAKHYLHRLHERMQINRAVRSRGPSSKSKSEVSLGRHSDQTERVHTIRQSGNEGTGVPFSN